MNNITELPCAMSSSITLEDIIEEGTIVQGYKYKVVGVSCRGYLLCEDPKGTLKTYLSNVADTHVMPCDHNKRNLSRYGYAPQVTSHIKLVTHD